MKNYRLIICFLILVGSGNLWAQELTEEQKKARDEQTKMATFAVNHAMKVYQTARSLNDVSAAKEALLDILVEVPQNDSIVFELGTLYFQLQMYQSSAVCAAEVLKKNPDNVGAIELAAVSYENLGAEQRALDNYEKLFLKTDDFNALYKASLFQYNLGRYKEADTNIDILLARKESDEIQFPIMTTSNEQKDYPIKALLYNIKGLIKVEQGNNAEAKVNFQKALEIAPDFAAAKEYLESTGN